MSVDQQDFVMQEVFDSLAELNKRRKPNQRLPLAPATVLFGAGSALDSMSLVTLIVGIEERLQDRHGIALTIADESAFAEKSSPFRTVETLANYIRKRIDGAIIA